MYGSGSSLKSKLKKFGSTLNFKFDTSLLIIDIKILVLMKNCTIHKNLISIVIIPQKKYSLCNNMSLCPKNFKRHHMSEDNNQIIKIYTTIC